MHENFIQGSEVEIIYACGGCLHFIPCYAD